MKGSQYLLIALVGIFIFGSCANSDQSNNIQTVQVTAETKANEKKEISADGDTITAEPYDITVDMEFLDTTSAENAEAYKRINRQLMETFLNTRNTDNTSQAVHTFIDKLRSECEQQDMTDGYDHFTGKAESGRDGVINYTLVEDYYGGGAHPSVISTILRFDANTGERIDLYGFFTDTCTHTLCDKLTRRLMEKVGVTTVDSLHALGYLADEDMFVSENFLLKRDSISFFYNQYDIAPYSVGTMTLSFSYEELKDYIRLKDYIK